MTTLRKAMLAALLAFGCVIAPSPVLIPLAGVAHAATPIPAEPDTERRTRYTATAQTGPFAVGFDIYGDGTDYQNWVKVFVNGVELAQSGNWTMSSVSGSFATLARPITNATITFTTAKTGTVDIVGARRPRRTSQFQESQPITARSMNQVLTDLWMTERERWDYLSRSLLAPPGETIGGLPSSTVRASSALGFDASGNPVALSPSLGIGTVMGPNSVVDGHVAVFNGTSGQLIKDGGTGIGTVLSVGLSLPPIFSVTGTPVTSSGTLTGSLATQSANTVWAGPTTGAATAPTFRALVGADLPLPAAATLGGAFSKAVVASNWLRSLGTDGNFTASQPNFTDLAGVASAAQLPNPSASTLGGVQSKAQVSTQWLNSISTLGVPTSSQPAFSDLSGSLGSTQLPALSGDVTTTGSTLVTTIATNAVTNAKAAQMAAATLKGNPTGSLANATDFTIQGLTPRGAPDAANDKVPIYDNAAGTIKYVTPNQIASAATAGVSSLNGLSGALSIAPGTGTSVAAAGANVTVNNTGVLSFNGQTGAVAFAGPPQGRLTLTTGTAVMTSSVTAGTTVYYTPAAGRGVPIFDGTNFVMVDIGGELSQATTDATKSPAAVAATQVYDVCVWLDGSTPRATRTPPWSSGTAGSNVIRGTGAGSAELELYAATNGTYYVNKFAITNGAAARKCTYVGTIGSNGTSTIDYTFGTSAAGGGAARLMVWNAYNQVIATTRVQDSTATWNYTSATPQNADASASNRITFVTGLAVNGFTASYAGRANMAAGVNNFFRIGLGLNATAFDYEVFYMTSNSDTGSNSANAVYPPKLGSNFIQAVEASDGTHSNQFIGNVASQGLSATLVQ